MGADVSNQYLRAGLIDEIHRTVVPVLFGDGTRLFDRLGPKHTELEYTMVAESAGVTHLRRLVVR